MEGKRRERNLMITALVLMIGGGLLAGFINSGAGAATVIEVVIKDPPGFEISAYLYLPKGVTPKMPAPGILVVHGLNNEKKYMANTALEFARRGYVVLSMDQPGHGRSSGANGDNGGGAVGALNYLRKLPMVDKDNIGLIGMSQGGFLSTTNAAFLVPDGYKSIFYMDSEVNAPGSFDLSRAEGLKNAAFSIGSVSELAVMIFVSKGTEAPVSPVLQPVFGTKDPIEIGKVYGSIADGTARILYQPWGTHPGSTDSAASIGQAIEWMQKTLKGGTGLAPSRQIWPWKFWGSTLALLGAFLFLFPMGSLLLKTEYFKSLVQEVPPFHGIKGAGWWGGAALATAIGPLLYVSVWKKMFFTPWINPNGLWPQTFTNVILVWGLIVAAITVVIILLTHFFITKKQGATLASYGLCDPGRGIDWGKVWKSLLLAACAVLPVYLIVAFFEAFFKVDFRLWIISLMPMSPERFQAYLGYLIPYCIVYASQAVLLAGLLRVREGKASVGMEMLTNSIVLVLGAVIWLLLLYGPLFAGGKIIYASDPIGVTAAGMGGIYYIPLLLFWPLAASLYTYFFRKTGRVFVGVFIVTLFAVWQAAALGVMGFPLS